VLCVWLWLGNDHIGEGLPHIGWAEQVAAGVARELLGWSQLPAADHPMYRANRDPGQLRHLGGGEIGHVTKSRRTTKPRQAAVSVLAQDSM
jgi:hypothetical protein